MIGEAAVILHVEDDMAHAVLVRRILEDFRIKNRIVHVQDGQAALDYLFRRGRFSDPESSPRPGIVLLDLRLPLVDGLEVLKIIKEDETFASIPVVILTTSAAERDLVSAYDNKANSYLVKPLEYKDFAAMLESFGYYWLLWNTNPFNE